MFRFLKSGLAAVLLLGVAACGDPSKADLVEKARGIDSKAELESVLGTPDDLQKVGPVEKWTYKAKDGQVVFVITGDSVTIQAAN